MPDFMISLFAQSGWLAWLVFALAVAGGMFLCALAGVMAGRVTDRMSARPPADDPPEYEPDEEPGEDWPEADENWLEELNLRAPEWHCASCGGGPIRGGNPPLCLGCRHDPAPETLTLAWGAPSPERAGQDMALLAEVLERAVELGLLEAEGNPERMAGERCADRDCDLFGFIHPPPCVLMPTMPAACYTDPGPGQPPLIQDTDIMSPGFGGIRVDRTPMVDPSGPFGPAGPPEPARAALEISDSQTMRRVDWESLAIAEQIRRMETGNG
jgi:hypothetical protein